MAHFMLEHALHAQQWERAKGELRALVQLKGSYSSGVSEEMPFIALENAVEKFIKQVEDEGLQEAV